MAKRCQEEYEDVSEVLHASTLSTLCMYIPWPRLNVCLTCLRSCELRGSRCWRTSSRVQRTGPK